MIPNRIIAEHILIVLDFNIPVVIRSKSEAYLKEWAQKTLIPFKCNITKEDQLLMIIESDLSSKKKVVEIKKLYE